MTSHTPHLTLAHMKAFLAKPNTMDDFYGRFNTALAEQSSPDLWEDLFQDIFEACQNKLLFASTPQIKTGFEDPDAQWVCMVNNLKRILNRYHPNSSLEEDFLTGFEKFVGTKAWGSNAGAVAELCEDFYVSFKDFVPNTLFTKTYIAILSQIQESGQRNKISKTRNKIFVDAMTRADDQTVKAMAPFMNLHETGTKNACFLVQNVEVLRAVEPFVDFRWDKSRFLVEAARQGRPESVAYLIPKSQPAKDSSRALHQAIQSWIWEHAEGESGTKNLTETIISLVDVSDANLAFFGYNYIGSKKHAQAFDILASTKAPKDVLLKNRAKILQYGLVRCLAECDKHMILETIGPDAGRTGVSKKM